MNFLLRILLPSFALASLATAELPKNGTLNEYQPLWRDSPFTAKPPDTGPIDIANPINDYALAGVSPITGGYRVTLLNKKNPEERIYVDSGDTQGEYKIVSVARKPGNPLGTTVKISSGRNTGTVGFDEKLLTLKAAPAAQPVQANGVPGQQPAQNGQPGQPPQAQPGQNGQPTQPGQRQPRPRVVPPPIPQAGNQAPGQQPQQQQGQPVRQERQERQNRR